MRQHVVQQGTADVAEAACREVVLMKVGNPEGGKPLSKFGDEAMTV
jgi:hypothetical protein